MSVTQSVHRFFTALSHGASTRFVLKHFQSVGFLLAAALSLVSHNALSALTTAQANAKYNKVFNTANGFVEYTSEGHLRPIYGNLSGYSNSTASEGTAYLMVLAALQGNKSHFDASYDYWYKYARNNTYTDQFGYYFDLKWLMPWLIDSSGVDRGNVPATDADFDIAYALLVAENKWGNNTGRNYGYAAREVIKALKRVLIGKKTNIALPWPNKFIDNETNQWSVYITSYNMPGYYPLFGRATNDTEYWNTVRNATYTWLKDKGTNATTGLNSFKVDYNGNPVGENERLFDLDAVRLPWRIAQDYTWTGDGRAKNLISKVSSFITSKHPEPTDVGAGYYPDGSVKYPDITWKSSPHLAMFSATVKANGANNYWANRGWDEVAVKRVGGDSYQQMLVAMMMFYEVGKFYDPTSNACSSNCNDQPVNDEPASAGDLSGKARLQDNWQGWHINTTSDQAWNPVSMLRINNGAWSMQWILEKVSGNTYRIKNRWSGLYLNAANTDEWSGMVTAPLNNNWGSMKWDFEKVSGNVYRVKNQWTGQYLTSGESEGAALLQANKRSDWTSQQFKVKNF